MDPYGAPDAVTSSSNKGADLDYGRAARNTATTCSSGRPPTTVDPP